MSSYAKRALLALGIVFSAGFSNISGASVILDGTRVIYPASKKEITAKVTNQNAAPVLIQSWIDNGNNTDDATQNIPFVLTPPINRIDAGKAQTLRISYLGSPALPQDRESVFWLNVLEVPTKAQAEDSVSKLNIAFRTRVKMFYRPDNLEGKPEDAMANLKWAMKGNGVNITNPSKYYVSIVTIDFISGGKEAKVKSKMIAPGATEFQEIQAKDITSISQLSYTAVNDYGGYVQFKAKP